MAKKNKLNNLGDKKHELTVLDNSKGGQSKSPAKVLSSRINGLMNRKDLSDDQRYVYALLKERRFVDAVLELITMNLERGMDDAERVDKAVEQLKMFVAQRNVNLNVDASGKSVNVQEYEKFRDAVFDIVTPEQRERILERSQQVGVPETTRDVLQNIFMKLKEEKDVENKKGGFSESK